MKNVFAQKGLNVIEYNIETEDIVDLPFIVYTATDGSYFQADGQNYLKFLNVTLAIFDETLTFGLQRQVEDVLDERSVQYDKQINFDSEQRIYTISYSFEVFDDAED